MTVINNLQDVFDIVVDGIYIIRDTIDNMNLYIGIHKISLWYLVGAGLVSNHQNLSYNNLYNKK